MCMPAVVCCVSIVLPLREHPGSSFRRRAVMGCGVLLWCWFWLACQICLRMYCLNTFMSRNMALSRGSKLTLRRDVVVPSRIKKLQKIRTTSTHFKHRVIFKNMYRFYSVKINYMLLITCNCFIKLIFIFSKKKIRFKH